ADPLDPDEDIVFQLYALCADRSEQEEMRARYRAGGYGFGNAKKALLAKIEESMEPFRNRRAELEADPGYVDDVLASGARTARAVARETLDRARTACGLGAVRG
ncbi:MAG: tryptophan--tRNA ligase, partial [Planctomycetota bacterium]